MGWEQDFKDVTVATRPHFIKGDGKIQTFFSHNQYEFVDNWFYGDKDIITGGDMLEFLAKVRKVGVAKHTSDLEEDEYSVTSTLEKGVVPWVVATTNWTWTKSMHLNNRGSAAKMRVAITSQRLNALEDLADLLEDCAIQAPTGPDDDRTPYGVPYWVVMGEAGQEGWLGKNPAGFDNCGGIDANREPGWRNYSARNGYTGVNDALLIIMERVYREMRFKAPKTVKDLASDPAIKKFRIYVPGDVQDDYSALMRSKNAQVGPDSSQFADAPTFKGHPLVWLDGLDNNEKKPIYFLDRSCFKVRVKEGDFFDESEPRKAPKQHRALVVDQDTSYNYVCTNKHKQGVIAKA